MKLRLIAMIVVAALAAGCNEPTPGQYRMGVREVFEKLHAADFKEFRQDRQCGILIYIKRDAVDYKSLTWRVTSGGENMLWFTARLVPIDAQTTKIDVEVSKERNGREAYDGTQTYARPAVQQPVRPAIHEQIDAILNDRPFNWQNARKLSSPNGVRGTFTASAGDRICNVQRGGLESGIRFRANDVKQNLLK